MSRDTNNGALQVERVRAKYLERTGEEANEALKRRFGQAPG
jgi:hypothetical protein